MTDRFVKDDITASEKSIGVICNVHRSPSQLLCGFSNQTLCGVVGQANIIKQKPPQESSLDSPLAVSRTKAAESAGDF